MRRSTNLPLILLVLTTGVALGWLVRDLFVPAGVGGDNRPTTIAVQPTGAPTLLPSLLPTVAPQPSLVPTRPAPTNTPPVPTMVPRSPTPVPATELPTAVPTVAAAPSIAGYVGYTVRDGDTLESIAQAHGSTPELIANYNLLHGEPHAGRALIIPQSDAKTPTSQPLLVRRGRGDTKAVALTLDAGGTAESTVDVLKALRERHVTITFFLTGTWMRENPDLTRQIVADGHEIANHTVTHRDLTRLGDNAIRDELANTEAILHEIAGENVSIRPFFRPPYGAYDERVLRVAESEGYLPIYWTLDSLDSIGEPKTAAFLVDRVTKKLSPEQLHGAIILAHCGFTWTAEALPTILDRFAEMGFEVKKLSEVLE